MVIGNILTIVFFVVGILVFALGYYFFNRYMKEGKEKRRQMRVWAVVSYLGVALAVLMGGQIVLPYVEDLSWGSMALLVIEIIIFIAAAYFIVRPAFSKEKAKEQETVKRITPSGTVTVSSQKPKKKKKHKNNSNYMQPGSSKRRMPRR